MRETILLHRPYFAAPPAPASSAATSKGTLPGSGGAASGSASGGSPRFNATNPLLGATKEGGNTDEFEAAAAEEAAGFKDYAELNAKLGHLGFLARSTEQWAVGRTNSATARRHAHAHTGATRSLFIS